MPLETMRLFFAMLALAVNVAFIAGLVLVIGSRFSPPLAEARASVQASIAGWELWMAFALALGATLGSLYFSEIVHFEPCKFCWFQRIAMYPLVPLLGIAAWKKDLGIRVYAASLAVPGAAIAAYHYLIQQFPGLSSGACAASGPPCTAAYVWEFNFVSIPYMALSAFTLILLLLAVAGSGTAEDEPSFSDAAVG